MSYKKKPGTINPDEMDPSVYYYDEVYDEMKEEKRSQESDQGSSSKDKVSKYTKGLLETAELRKNEKELRKLKRYARDRLQAEAEGDLSNQDIYVTPAYKEKLKQMEHMEKERRSRLEQEQSNTMNFLKKTTSSKNDHQRDHQLKPEKPSTSDSTKDITDIDCDKKNLSPKSRKFRPRTIKERREYLRDILAKRTIGKVYDDALERYIKRKAEVQ